MVRRYNVALVFLQSSICLRNHQSCSGDTTKYIPDQFSSSCKFKLDEGTLSTAGSVLAIKHLIKSEIQLRFCHYTIGDNSISAIRR